MNILPINNTNSLNFNGRILTVGKGWNSQIKNTFRFNPEIIELAKGSHDVIGCLYTKKASMRDYNHDMDEPLYRMDLMLGNSKFEFINKIMARLNLLPKVRLIHDYHCESSFLERLQKRPVADILKEKFGINK